MVLLPNEAHLLVSKNRSSSLVKLCDFTVAVHDSSGGRLVQTSDQMQKCALAGSAFAGDGHLFIGADEEIQVLENREVLIARFVNAGQTFDP